MRFASWAICSLLFIAFTSSCLTRRKTTRSDGSVDKEHVITRPLKNKFKDWPGRGVGAPGKGSGVRTP